MSGCFVGTIHGGHTGRSRQCDGPAPDRKPSD
nr:MAG TPA: hypothetical protein [Caudoviricetes sp.]